MRVEPDAEATRIFWSPVSLSETRALPVAAPLTSNRPWSVAALILEETVTPPVVVVSTMNLPEL